jgi:hypothetical protein
MQTNIKKLSVFTILMAGCLSLLSFSNPKGGDSFEIFLNHKLVLQQYLYGDRTVKSLVLTEANYNDKLSIKYSHCGVPGKQRTITLKDAQDRVVRQWTFANASGHNTAMTCSVKEIMDLQKTKGNISLKLSYSSAELPKGHVLVSITKGSTSVATR